MQFFEINICRIMIFRLYTAYNKHEMIKIGSPSRKKSQVLSQNFSSAYGNICNFSLIWLPVFFLMLVISSVKPKDHDSTNIYLLKLH